MRRLVRYALVLLALTCAIGLSADTENDEQSRFLANLARNNLIDTDASYFVIQQAVAPVGDIHADSGEPGYILYQFTADVLHTLKGPALGQVQYRVGYEASIPATVDPTQPLLVSLCHHDDGSFYIPDNGYRFAIDREQLVALRDEPIGPAKDQDCSH